MTMNFIKYFDILKRDINLDKNINESDSRIFFLQKVYSYLFRANYSYTFYKIFLKKNNIYVSNFNVVKYLGTSLFIELIDFALLQKENIAPYQEELKINITNALINFQTPDNVKNEGIQYLFNKIEEFSNYPSLKNLLSAIELIKSKELYLNVSIIKSIVNLAQKYIKKKDISEERIEAIFKDFTKCIFICNNKAFKKEYMTLIEKFEMNDNSQYTIRIFKGIILGLNQFKNCVKTTFSVDKEIIIKDIQNLSKKKSKNIDNQQRMFWLFEDLMGYIKDLARIINNRGVGRELNEYMIKLFQFEEYYTFGMLLYSNYVKQRQKEEHFSNPYELKEKFINFYDNNEQNEYLVNYFIDSNIKENNKNNNEPKQENSIVSSSDKNENYKNKKNPIINFLWLVHFHPNPFIFKVFEQIQNKFELQEVLRALCKELVEVESDNLGKSTGFVLHNHNSFYFVNLIRLFRFINSYCMGSDSKDLWENGLLIKSIKNLNKYLKELGFLSVRYVCFSLDANHKERKKTIVEFFFDLLIFVNRKGWDDLDSLSKIIRELLEDNVKKYMIKKPNQFPNFFSKSCYAYLNEPLMELPEEAFYLLFLSKILATLKKAKIEIFTNSHSGEGQSNEPHAFVMITKTIIEFLIKSKSISPSICNGTILTIKELFDKWVKENKKETRQDSRNFQPYLLFIQNTLHSLDNKPMKEWISSDFKLEVYKKKESKKCITINLKEFQIDDKIHNELDNDFSKYYSNNKIEDIDYFLINPKTELFLSKFSLIFKKTYFHNDFFITIKNYYHSLYNTNSSTKLLDYPSKIKNFNNGIEPNVFLCQNMKFFDSVFFPLSHKYIVDYFKDKKFPLIKQITLYKSILNFDIFAMPQIECEMITRQNTFRGIMFFNKLIIYFTTAKNKESRFDERKLEYIMCSITKEIKEQSNKEIIISVKDIKQIVLKRFLYREQACEVYLSNGKNYFFNFYNNKNAFTFIKFICKLKNISIEDEKENYESPSFSIIGNCKSYVESKKLHSLWKKGKISTFKYLCLLNKYASRSFNDSNQYYVFPWIIMNYDKFLEWTVKEDKIENYRIMKLPPSVQDKDNQEKARDKYELCLFEKDKSDSYAFHFGSHYSTSSFVYYYLMRMSPFLENMIKLQNFELETPDRMFTSINETRKIVITLCDNRELIPEFYSMMEFLLNLNCCALGRQSNSELIDDWKLDDLSSKKCNEIKDYVHFFIKNNFYLQNVARASLHLWVDNIFGCNQFRNKKENKDLLNTYAKSTYEEKTEWDKKIKKYAFKFYKCEKTIHSNEILPDEIIERIKDKKGIVLNFGQTPKKIFDDPTHEFNHYAPLIENPKGDDEFSFFGAIRQKKKYCIFRENNPILFFIRSIRKEMNNYSLLFFKDRTILIKDSLNEGEDTNLVELLKLPNLKLFKDKKTKKYRYCPKYALTSFKNGEILITGRHTDNSFMLHFLLYDKKKVLTKEKVRSVPIYCEAFVNAVSTIDDQYFLTGLSNGKLIKWQYLSDKHPLVVQSIFAHQGAVTLIEYYERLHIVITGGEDHFVYVRKAETFELLTMVKMENYHVPYLIRISECNLMYVMTYCLKHTKYVYMIDYKEYKRNLERLSKEEQNAKKQRQEDIESKIEENKEKGIGKKISDLKPKAEGFHEFYEEQYENECKENPGNYMITGYTLSGMKFANTNCIDISCFDIVNTGHILISFYERCSLEFYNAHTLTVSKFHFKIRIYAENNQANMTWIDLPTLYEDYFLLFSTYQGLFSYMTINRKPLYNIFFPVKKPKRSANYIGQNHNNNHQVDDENSQRTSSSYNSHEK